MKTTTADDIVRSIARHSQMRVPELIREFGFSRVSIHRQLKRLTAQGRLIRIGSPPLVFYKATTVAPSVIQGEISDNGSKQCIEKFFLFITPDGKLLFGETGFLYWAHIYQPSKDIGTLAMQYQQTIDQKQRSMPHGWLDATEKVRSTFPESALDRLLLADTYSDSVFGRTKLAKLVMHAKQSQNKQLLPFIIQEVRPIVSAIITKFSIEAVGYIPPTIPRAIQFMHAIERELSLPLPQIDLVKVMPGQIPVPQKSLEKLEERIINARESIYLRHNAEPAYQHVLLIDDVAGSGASLEETAKKLKGMHTGYQSITGFAVVGNPRGYAVIRQM